MQKFPAKVLSKAITETSDGDLVIPVIGIPFKGVIAGNRDLSGDFFHEKTELGPLNTVMSFFDHGLDKWYVRWDIYDALEQMGVDPVAWDAYVKTLGDIGFGEKHIGVAEKADVTPEGVMYRIIVNRRHRYKEMLRQLAEEGHLDASSGAKTRIDDKSVPGKIDYWSVAEISLTPTPMNPMAAAKIAKSLFTLGVGMEDEKVVATPITDALHEAVAEDKSAEAVVSESMADLVKKLIGEVAAVRTENAALKQEFANFATDMKTAIPELGKMIAKSLTVQVREEVSKSKAEVRVETAATVKSPAVNGRSTMRNWPGS